MSKWIINSQENNGILMVITLPSGTWMESVADTRAYLVIFSDEERTVESHQSYLGKSCEHRLGTRGPRLFDSSNLYNNITDLIN